MALLHDQFQVPTYPAAGTEVLLARTDIIVLGAGIVGTSIALSLVKRGLTVALIDRAEPGRGTSYGNSGIIEGNTVFPAAFPSSFAELAGIALKRSSVANYHLGFLPKIAPWLAAFRAASQPARLVETAQIMRPLLARAVPEHEAFAAEAGAERHFTRRGWLKLYRTRRLFEAQKAELDLAARFGIANVALPRDEALAFAQAKYERAIRRRLGVKLGALCRAGGTVYCYVYRPSSKLEAEYHLMPDGLKLSVPTPLREATLVCDPEEWENLQGQEQELRFKRSLLG